MSESHVKHPPGLKERLETICAEMIEKGILFSEAVSQFEKCFIVEFLAQNGGNHTKAAERLGIHRNTLAKKISRYKIRSRAKAITSSRS